MEVGRVEGLSLTTFWLALGFTAASVLFYWGYSFGARVVLRRLATNGDGGVTVATFEWLPESLGRLASLTTWAATAFVAVSLFARWRAVGHAPWSNMWEFTLAFAGGVMLFYIVFERWYGQRTIGSFIQPVVLALMAVAAAFFPAEVRPLVPALQNQDLLALHVATMILAYGALSVSFGAGVMYLIQGGDRNRFPRLPKAGLLDQIGYRSVIVGFPLLALGIALGAYWGNSAWGRYWGWDPKETSSLVTWLIYAAYLHTRGRRGWTGTRAAVILVLGFIGVLFTYFVVNLWVSGLHSYAGV
ncbi:MAG: c-type cytochrome biogenesis protein CcsB [Dehalococcoidia bacterium]|nr:MAG: c-type cytochrome biogenesis protein CcsB [Dehalococcoidia bacterium]